MINCLKWPDPIFSGAGKIFLFKSKKKTEVWPCETITIARVNNFICELQKMAMPIELHTDI